MSPKNTKRQKVIEKQEMFTQLLKPININDCDGESQPDPDIQAFSQKLKLDGKPKGSKLYKKIDGEDFIDNAPTKFQMRHLNVIDISDVDIVLVSSFNDLYGLPFITRLPDFKGKVMMTQPIAQIGYHLVMEFVIQNTKRNLKRGGECEFLKHEKLHEVFARLGIEEWQELYTVEEVEECFNKHVTPLSFNENFAFDNLISVTAVSSGYHIGSSNWFL